MEELLPAKVKKTEESLTLDEIREMCKMREMVRILVEKHPNKLVVVQVMICLMTMQCHISTKYSKGGKRKCPC